jgi:hypothetical protein
MLVCQVSAALYLHKMGPNQCMNCRALPRMLDSTVNELEPFI